MQINLKDYMSKPLFIALEGLDGVGKSTQAKLLCDALNNEGITTTITAEAKGTPIADVIRSEYLSGKRKVDNFVNALAFSADRYDRFTEEENGVFARLERGESVVADRFVLSSLVYSSLDSANPTQSMDIMADINSKLMNRLYTTAKIFTFFIYYDAEEAQKFLTRVESRGATEIYETAEKQAQLLKLYEQALSHYVNIIRIPVTPLMSIQELHDQIMKNVTGIIIKGLKLSI